MSVQSIDNIRRIMEIFASSDGEIRPHFIVVGPSGSGKSHTIETLAADLGIQYFDINAASLTKEGTAGNSVSKALAPLLQTAGNPTLCFVDEFDKLFISGNVNSALAHETTNGVQNEFLRVLEGRATVAGDYGKFHTVDTSKTLFVFAGAFNGEDNIDLDRLRELGIKTEFLGRVGLVYGLQKVTLDQLRAILTSSPLLAKYLTLFPSVKRQAVEEAVMQVVEANFEKNTIGVRLLNTLVHQYFIEGGIKAKQAKKTTFQRTLSLH